MSPPVPAKPATPPAVVTPCDGLLHEMVIKGTGKTASRVAKCSKADGVAWKISPRAGFVREARRMDPAAESEGRVPDGVCADCWPGNGLIVRAPAKGKGSVAAVLKARQKIS